MGKKQLRGGSEIDRTLWDLERRADASMLEELVASGKKKSGSPAKASVMELLRGLVLHALSEVGTLGEHFAAANGKRLAESTLSERRRNISWDIFSKILAMFLRPLATEKRHPEAFYKGYRLVGIDGSAFSLRNTAAILRDCTKVVSRRMQAAFAKIRGSVLVEIGIHNPIGAAIGSRQESEGALSKKLLQQLPAKCLLLGDRYYGSGKFISLFIEQCKESRCLFRVNSRNKARLLKKLKDGSRIVEVSVRDKDKSYRIEKVVTLREIHATLRRKGYKAVHIRLWTNLLSHQEAPAAELVQLYGRRWEHETYFRELKCVMTGGSLLASQTIESACQEIAALLIASSIVAEHRIRAAKKGLKVTAIGFAHALFNVRCLWEVLPTLSEFLSPERIQQFGDSMRAKLQPDKVPKKRARSCPRAVRQPIKGWPRLVRNSYVFGDPVIKII